MQITKTHKIIISAVIVVILLAIYIIIDKKSLQAPSGETDVTGTTTPQNGVGTTPGSGGYKIEQVPIVDNKTPTQPIPDLNRPITVFPGAVVAPEAKAYAEEKIKSLQARLKTNTKDINAWIDLAINQKNVGDYAGAVLSLKYANYLAPNDYVALAGLGNLYAYFLHDNAQAEIYYKRAIEKGPLQVNLYAQLVELYRDIFKDLDKANTVITQGLSRLPNDPYLLQLKTTLK